MVYSGGNDDILDFLNRDHSLCGDTVGSSVVLPGPHRVKVEIRVVFQEIPAVGTVGKNINPWKKQPSIAP